MSNISVKYHPDILDLILKTGSPTVNPGYLGNSPNLPTQPSWISNLRSADRYVKVPNFKGLLFRIELIPKILLSARNLISDLESL